MNKCDATRACLCKHGEGCDLIACDYSTQ